MKASINSLLLLFFFVGIAAVSSQTKHNPNRLSHVIYPENVKGPLTAMESSFILEAYGKASKLLILDNPQRLKDIKHILRNRVEFMHLPKKDLSSLTNLSEIPLFNKYNNSISRDAVFDKESFNPLKYQFNFDSAEGDKTFRFNNSEYLIIIKSQQPKKV